jgi:two-component system, sporulation sensor kinase D
MAKKREDKKERLVSRRKLSAGAYQLRPRRRGYFIELYFIIGMTVISAIMFTYSQLVVNRLRQEYKKTSTAYAIVSSMLISSRVQEVTDQLASDIGDTMNFPSVLTDTSGNYIASKNLGFNIDENNPADLDKASLLVKKMDQQNLPIPIIRYHMNPNTYELMAETVFLFHYQEPAVVTLIKWLPVAQIILVVAFLLIGVFTYRRSKQGEQTALWVGMAKETAHQLSTPTSSLIGWLELLRDIDFSALDQNDQKLVQTALTEIGWDVHRLSRITERFGSIGTKPALHRKDLVECVRRAVDYYRTRFNFSANGIELVEKYPSKLLISINSEQISWCCENLLKNAVTAVSGKAKSRIAIMVEEDPVHRSALIEVSDNGQGISSSALHHIFEPGFTTKRRGWGMGLSLVKRIVEEYHDGRVEVNSAIGKGTTFTLRLPMGSKQA